MEKQDKAGDKGILARTATYTSKKARRAQEKLMQKVGKSDETKDEVFDEFVNNFNKQQSSATRLMKELRNYVQCVSSMQVATDAFGEALREVYEEDWCQKDELVSLFEKLNKDWLTLHRRLSEEVLEPLNSYHKPFADVKVKISKRGRKLVDYDHCRHTVDTFRAKGTAKASDAKRLQQAEDEYQKAKSVFLELTADLYDELPALYDSRISFYVSCFQSIFTLEGVFHREAAKVNSQLNEVLDQLTADASTGSYSSRKPFPAVVPSGENEKTPPEDVKKPSAGSLATFYDVAVPEDETNHNAESTTGESEPETKTISTPPNSVTSASPTLSPRTDEQAKNETSPVTTPQIPPRPVAAPIIDSPSVQPQPSQQQEERNAATNGTIELEAKPVETEIPSTAIEHPEKSPELQKKEDTEVIDTPPSSATEGNESESTKKPDVATVQSEPTASGGRVVPDTLFKVMATFNYNGEDDDELSFEKGELIHVIEFEDPDDQDEGWLYGVLDSSGQRGMFPENFTKRLP